MLRREVFVGMLEIVRDAIALLPPQEAERMKPHVDKLEAVAAASPLLLAEAVFDQRVIDGTHVIRVDGPVQFGGGHPHRVVWRFWYRIRHGVIERQEVRGEETFDRRWWGMASLNLPDLVQRAEVVEAATVPGVLV